MLKNGKNILKWDLKVDNLLKKENETKKFS